MLKEFLTAVISAGFVASAASAASLVEQKLDYSDHLQELHNPARGTTHHKGYFTCGRERSWT